MRANFSKVWHRVSHIRAFIAYHCEQDTINSFETAEFNRKTSSARHNKRFNST